jgi:SRSO17 transposase
MNRNKAEKPARLPQAPRAPLPELAEFLAPLRVHFTQGPSAATLRQYVTGLLSEAPLKNCDTLATIVPATNEQQLHHLLTEMVWDEVALNRQRIAQMQALPSEGDGVLIVDDTGFEKKGRQSVGVARQYTGTAGKITNCQVTVNCHYAERTLAWPVATRLYLPEEWANDVGRRQQAHVPAVRANFSVTLGHSPGSPVCRADEVLAAQPRQAWRTITWSEGATGGWRAKCLALRCWRIDGDGTRHVGWLIGQRPSRGQHGDWKYFWSDFPAPTPLAMMVEYAHRRHWVEQYHEEAKTELGWDQYQGRRWDGFHRHALTVMLSYSFLVWLEARARD